MIGGIEEIQEFLKNTTFQQKMEEAEDKYRSIFICALKSNSNKKIATSLKRAYEFLDKIGKEIFSKRYAYLLDESNDFKIIRSEPGFNIPVKKDDLNGLLDLLIKGNEKDKLGFFIDMSHKNPFSKNQFIKTQFKNIPPDVDKDLAKNMFNSFGEIQEIYHKDGIWTVLFQQINWLLPYAHHQHLKAGSKDRWFTLGNAQCSFASKIPCSNCHIIGHSKSKCPGDQLIDKLKKEQTSKKNDPKNPIHTKEKDNSFSDLLVDLDISDIDQNKTPSKQKKPLPNLNKASTIKRNTSKKKKKDK
jgi:hypothetical protein